MNYKSAFTDVYASAISVFKSSSEVQLIFWDYSAFAIFPVVGMSDAFLKPLLMGRGVDVEGFETAMAEQKAKARAAWAGSGEAADAAIWYDLGETHGATDFLGYDTETAEGQIMALNGSREGLFAACVALSPETKRGKRPAVLMPNPFYQVYAVAALAAGAEPVSIMVEAFGTENVAIERIEKAAREVFDFSPSGIIRTLDLKKPIYQETAAYGHFGRDSFSWEKTDRADELKTACGV